MACDLWHDRIDAFVDGELPPETLHEFYVHVQTCPACAQDVASRVQLKGAIKRAGRRFTPNADFRRRIETQVSPRRRNWSLAWIPAVAAAILLAIVWIAGRGTPAPGNAAIAELVDLHIATLASTNPVDVVSTDLHTVKPWFEGKLPFSVNVPDLTNTEFTLLGGRVAYLDQQPGAELLFQYRKHRLSAYIFQDRPQWKDSAIRVPFRSESFWVESWTWGGLRYFVIGDTSPANIHDLSGLLAHAAGPS
jgi:anti-sigma factor RsiW